MRLARRFRAFGAVCYLCGRRLAIGGAGTERIAPPVAISADKQENSGGLMWS
jgi:hypothetical protein